MNKKYRLILLVLLFIAAALAVAQFVRSNNIQILNPKGIIAGQERDLIAVAVFLMFIAVIPALITLYVFAWKYRAGNTKAKYTPDWGHNKTAEIVWWAFPSVIIFVLAIITWKGTHALDPYKPIESTANPLRIQVVALQWKWLFIYPEQGIATVNFVQFPERTPVNFELTADAPMNSFWIPQLGGQMYAMAGMSTQLHLMADETGEFMGVSAEISGRGFAGMKFVAKASSQSDFDQWVAATKKSTNALTLDTYNKLAEPSENNQAAFYASVEKDLYNTIMMKFMAPMKHEARNM